MQKKEDFGGVINMNLNKRKAKSDSSNGSIIKDELDSHLWTFSCDIDDIYINETDPQLRSNAVEKLIEKRVLLMYKAFFDV